MRAIGYEAFAVAASVVIEAVVLSLIGAALGAWVARLIDGRLQAIFNAVFTLSISTGLIALGLGWAVLLAVLGGLRTAVRSARARRRGFAPGLRYACVNSRRLQRGDLNAFMSYSHAADGMLAPALQSALHRFAKPWYRPGRSISSATRPLAVTPKPRGAIQAALDQSTFFILLASPESAASIWVQQEIEYWLKAIRRSGC